MKKKAVLYPFCEEALPAVKLFDMLQDTYELVYLVAPSGWGCVGKDAGYVCHFPELGKKVLKELPLGEEWETLLIFEPALKKGTFFLKERIEEAVLIGKEVVFLCTAENKVPKAVEHMKQIHPDMVKISVCHRLEEEDTNGFQEPEIPVLLVGGLLKEADCFFVFSSLMERFQREGERVVAFSDHPMGSLFGFYSLEHIWRNQNYSEDEKVEKINFYVNLVARKSGAGLILLEAPDALMKYDDKALNGFGIRSYMLCQAVPPDYLIGCIPFELTNAKLLSMLSEDFSYRLGCGFQAVHISNVMIDTADSKQHQKIEILHTDLKLVQEQIEREQKNSEIPMFDVVGEGIERMYERIRENG